MGAARDVGLGEELEQADEDAAEHRAADIADAADDGGDEGFETKENPDGRGGLVEAGAAKAGMPPLAAPAAGPSAREFRAVMQSVLHGGAWMALSNLANEVYARLPGCSPKRFGHATFGKLVMAQGDLVEHRPNPETPGGEVRLRTKGCRSDAAPLLREALTGKDWQALSAVGQALRKLEPGFNVRRYGHAQLQKLLRAHPQLIECRPASGTVQHVRLRA